MKRQYLFESSQREEPAAGGSEKFWIRDWNVGQGKSRQNVQD